VTDPTPVTPSPPLNVTQTAAPTFGAIVGSALGAFLESKLAPGDPLLGHTIVTLVTAVVTGLFHLAATKLGSLAI
jgi:hypothetical protein